MHCLERKVQQRLRSLCGSRCVCGPFNRFACEQVGAVPADVEGRTCMSRLILISI